MTLLPSCIPVSCKPQSAAELGLEAGGEGDGEWGGPGRDREEREAERRGEAQSPCVHTRTSVCIAVREAAELSGERHTCGCSSLRGT